MRTGAATQCVRIDADVAVQTGHADVGELLRSPNWRELAAVAEGASHEAGALDYAPLVTRPGKIVCVGLNYAHHIQEMGRELPRYPTLFAKYAEALVGAYDDIIVPAVSVALDWEAELAVIIGSAVRRANERTAEEAIAGYSVINDVTARDWQNRTEQWLQGKTFESTTPLGPHLVTPDDTALEHFADGFDVSCIVDDETMQSANTNDLVFSAIKTIEYVSTILTLQPGDVLALGTPGGVGYARTPPRYLSEGQLLTTEIAGLGVCRNRCVADGDARRVG